MYCHHVGPSPCTTSNLAADKIRKLDVDLCDELGTIRVRLRGLSSRALVGDTSASDAAPMGTLLLHPRWSEQAAAGPALDMPRQLIVFCDLPQCSPRSLSLI